jgi:hypothetical protein
MPIVKKDKEHLAEILKTSLGTVERYGNTQKGQESKGEEVDLSTKREGKMWNKEESPWSRKNTFNFSEQSLYIEGTSKGATCTLFYAAKKVYMGQDEAPRKQP